MIIGCPNNPRRDFCKEARWCLENGFDYLDLYLEEGKSSPDNVDPVKIRELLDRFTFKGPGHTPWYLPIGSPVASIREAAVRELGRYFEVFGKAGVGSVAVHASWCGAGFSVKEMIGFQVESLRKAVSAASLHGVRVLFELTDRKEDSPENMRAIMEEVGDVGFLLDTGHANLWGRKPSDYIRELHDRIEHVHAHDNFKDMDLHLPIGCGSIDWEATIRQLVMYYDGTITLEVFSRSRDYVLFSRDRLLRLLGRA